MRLRFAAALPAFIAALVLMSPTSSRGQVGQNRRAANHLASLKVGQWIRIEGYMRDGQSALCTEVRQLTGDFLDDDWMLKGTVQAIHPEKREFTIGVFRVRVAGNTGFDKQSGLSGFSDLRRGRLVEVEGTYQKHRTLLASEVDNETDEMKMTPRSKDWIQLAGRVERVDSGKKLLSTMGVDFQITEKTRLRSVTD